MTTVEAIVQDFLDRGHSMEELRLLALSKSGPLGEKLLAVLDGMAAVGGADEGAGASSEDSGPCETAAYPVAMTEEDMVFFVAGDEEDMAAGDAEKYDVMAETAAEDESVADIVIGETDGSGLVRSDSMHTGLIDTASDSDVFAQTLENHHGDASAESAISAEAGREQSGILNRLWSRMSARTTSGGSHSFAMIEKLSRAESASSTTDLPDVQEGAEIQSSNEDSGIADVSGSALYFEAVAEESSIAIAEASEVYSSGDASGNVDDEIHEQNTHQEEPLDRLADEDENTCDDSERIREKAGKGSVGSAAVSDSSSFCPHAEMSADYLPGSVSDIYSGNDGDGHDILDDAEKEGVTMEAGRVPETVEEARMALLEAQRLLAAAREDATAAPSVDASAESTEEPVAESAEAMPEAPVAESSMPAAVGSEEEGSKKNKSKARRKRERARRKRAEKNAGKEDALPEIVLMRPEGTETLMPEKVSEEITAASDAGDREVAVESSDSTDVGAVEAKPMDTEAVGEIGATSGEGDCGEAYLPIPASAASLTESGAESADAGNTEVVGETETGAEDDAAGPRMRQAITLLTPLDLLGEDSNVEEMFGFVPDEAVAEGVAEPEAQTDPEATGEDAGEPLSGASQEEIFPVEKKCELDEIQECADSGVEADDYEAGDHCMIIAGGGIQYDEYASLLPPESEYEEHADGRELEVVSEQLEESQDSASSNVILFSEKYAVFSGVRADEAEEEEESRDVFQLHMLPYVAGDAVKNIPSEENEGVGETAFFDTDAITEFSGLKLLNASGDTAESVVEGKSGLTVATDSGDDVNFALEEALSAEGMLGSEDVFNAEESFDTEEAVGLDETLAVDKPAVMEETCSMEEPIAQEESFDAEVAEESGDSGVVCAEDDGGASEPVAESAGLLLDEADRKVLARALYGIVDDSWLDMDAEVVDISTLHAIVPEEPEGAARDTLVNEAMVRAEMEAEYQERLDEFAARILQAQAAQAAEAEKVNQKQSELDARTAIIEEMQKRLDAEEMRIGEIAGKLAEANSKIDEKNKELKSRDKEREVLSEIRGEHGRLYKEFEDLRKGYNEIVSDVLPKLQGERDDLVLTVERQCADEEKMRGSLSSVRKRLAVGYSLAGAACLALCALPVAYWIQSGKTDREMAFERQKLAELHETLQREVQGNIVARNTIVELENKVGLARAQLTDMHRKNEELARLSRQRQPQQTPMLQNQHNQDVAVFKPSPPPSAGTPTRASEMALQATGQPGGRLHVNQVRDPSGSIEELAFQNRRTHQQRDATGQLARGQGGDAPRPVALSAVNQVAGRNDASALRPVGQGSGALVSMPPSLTPPSVASGTGAGNLVAKVKKGEGVAQVVYRVLGTWDSEVIEWVVKENNLAMDKRGNPRIHPDQELRLPKNARLVQSATAGRNR